jgi:hypothetical protein
LIEVFAGVNGWGYTLTQGNTQVGAGGAEYGATTQQYNELAALWSTYRLDSVLISWEPAQIGSGVHTPIVSCIDPAGATAQLGVNSYFDAIEAFSRLRSMKTHSSLAKRTQLVQDYRNWIMQTCPQTYL